MQSGQGTNIQSGRRIPSAPTGRSTGSTSGGAQEGFRKLPSLRLSADGTLTLHSHTISVQSTTRLSFCKSELHFLQDVVTLQAELAEAAMLRQRQEETLHQRERELTALKGALKEEIECHDREMEVLREQYSQDMENLRRTMEQVTQVSHTKRLGAAQSESSE